jgi:hypothetical protein
MKRRLTGSENMSGTDKPWKETAQNDPWRTALTKQIEGDGLEDLIATARLKPVPILASAFDAAKLLHKSPQGSTRNSSKSKFDVHNGGFLLTNKNPRFGVTLGSVDRALSIVNFILHHCQRYGIKAELDSSQYVNTSHGRGRSRLSINERIEEVYVAPDAIAKRAKPVAGRRVKRGTGQLSITIYGAGTRRFVDHGNDTLEKQITKIITKIVQALAERNACLNDLDQWMAKRKEAELTEAAEVAHSKNLAEQVEAMRAAHLARDQELLAEAAAWDQAASIRRYADHIRAKAESSTQSADPKLSAWICWAMDVAESLDPTETRICGLPSLAPGSNVE